MSHSRSPSSSFSSKASKGSYFPFFIGDEKPPADDTTVTPLDSPPIKSKGSYCFYTKKKDEVEAAHQDEGVRMIMLILHNWLTHPPVPPTKGHNRRLSFSVPPEQLYLNSLLTALPLTVPDQSQVGSPLLVSSVSSSQKWRDLAEQVWAELREARPSLFNGPMRELARAVLLAIHGRPAPSFAHEAWKAKSGRYIDSRLMYSEVGAPKSGRSFEVVISGGGPVGLTTAILLYHSTAMSTSTSALPSIRIKVYDQRWTIPDADNPRSLRWRDQSDFQNPNTRRRQVITLQDYVVALLDEGFKSAVGTGWSDVVWPADKVEVGIDTRKGAERVYVNSRQAPIRDVEDRLLMEIRDSPLLSSMIELVPKRMNDEIFESLRGSLDLFVGADGASAKAYTVNHQEDGKRVFDREILEAQQTDRALGIPIQGAPRATQTEIVFLTLCQTIYLLNSTANGLGFLNIRLSSDLYDALAAIPPDKRTLANLLESTDPLHIRVVALIDAGFRLYGMDISTVLDQRINVFRLSLASAPKTVKWVNKAVSKGRSAGTFPIVLVGDAAMQHNFWPGRGAKSGLLAAWALAANVVRSFEIPNFRGLVDAHMAPYEGFMRSLKVREHDGRGRFIQMIDIERIYAQAFPATSIPIPTLQATQERLVKRALLWRDRLGTRPEFLRIHPNKVSDEVLADAIGRLCGMAYNIVTRNTPMAIMDGAILTLLEGSQQWPTSEMNPLGYDLSPKGFIQPSYEDIGMTIVDNSPPSSRLAVPTLADVRRSRRSSWSGSPAPTVPAPPEVEHAIDTHPAWLAMALLGPKPEVKAWGDASKSAEKAYRKAMKAGYDTRFQKLYDKIWE